MTFEQGLMCAVGALTGAVSFLFLRIEARERERDKERQKLYQRITRLERINGIMQGVKSCPLDGCPFVNAMKAEASEDSSQDPHQTSCSRHRD